MKKLLIVLGVLLALGVVALVVMTFFLGSIVKSGITRVGPSLTGTPVSVDNATISPFSGTGTVSGFAVGNPQGWQGENAFYLGQVDIDMDPMSLFSDTIVVESIVVAQPQIHYETRLVQSNIKDILSHIEEVTGGPGASTSPGKKFIIHHLAMTNAEVTVGAGPAALAVPMPDLTFTELGVAEGGLTSEQLAQVIMRRVLGDIATVAAQAALQLGKSGGLTTDALGGAAQQAGESLRRLLRNGDAAPAEQPNAPAP